MESIDYWIDALELTPHVEGGWFRQTYASEVAIGDRASATSIYFLLSADNFSAFHRLTADEMWYFHHGATITIVAIDLEGKLHNFKLGKDIAAGESLQVLIPKGWSFASYVDTAFSVVSCMVTPGFTFDDFTLLKQADLLRAYPEHASIIKQLTRI